MMKDEGIYAVLKTFEKKGCHELFMTQGPGNRVFIHMRVAIECHESGRAKLHLTTVSAEVEIETILNAIKVVHHEG